MTDQIRQLIAANRTEDALQLLINAGYSDATLLKGQYASGKSNYNMNLINFQEWSSTQSRIVKAVLEMLPKGSVSVPATTPAYREEPRPQGGNTVESVLDCLSTQKTFEGAVQCFNRATEDPDKRKKFAEENKAWKEADQSGRYIGATEKMGFMQTAVKAAEAILSGAVEEDFSAQEGMLGKLIEMLDKALTLPHSLAMEAMMEKVMNRIELTGQLAQQRYIAEAYTFVAEARTNSSSVKAAKKELESSQTAGTLESDLLDDDFVVQANKLYTTQIKIAIEALKQGIIRLTDDIIDNRMKGKVRR